MLSAFPYPAQTPLSGDRFAPVTAAINERGNIRLEQRGTVLFLTPGELASLAALAGV